MYSVGSRRRPSLGCTVMDEGTLKRLLGAGQPTSGRPGWRCLKEDELAAYAEQHVSAEERARIESHLAGCDACLEQVVFLARLPEVAPAPAVASASLARAEGLVAAAQRPRLAPVLRWGSLAAAACLILIAGLQWRQSNLLPVPEAPGATAPTVPEPPTVPPVAPAADTSPAPGRTRATVRRSPAAPAPVGLISPHENETLPVRDAVFTWHAEPGALYYELQVVTEDGTVAWQAQADAAATRARLPIDHLLRAGSKYFVWVRAHLANGGSLRSTAVSFTVGAQ